MKFLDKLRSRSRANLKEKKRQQVDHSVSLPTSGPNFSQYATPRADFTLLLPPPLLERIFSFVCPHANDESYANAELSGQDHGCPLCDMRDLAHCMLANRRWYKLAGNVLYHSIRIDSVHYCPLEDILGDKRGDNRDWSDRDIGDERFNLLIKTLRERNPALGSKVLFFKLPYMIRNHSIKDLALAVGAMPNLLHVDLPDGFFTDDPKTSILRAELQARCQNIRKMTYSHGSEGSLQQLARGAFWQNLEVLDLENLLIDPGIIRCALGVLPKIKALKLVGIKNVDDSLFMGSPRVPPFPALEELILENTPHITGDGIVGYLSNEYVRRTLNTLSFSQTGVLPSQLYMILGQAPCLVKLSIIETVHRIFSSSKSPTSPDFPPNSLSSKQTVPPLISSSLEVLNYEILGDDPGQNINSTLSSVVNSYYDYLTQSLLSGGLPNLQTLYVRDENFTDSLITFAPPVAPFAGGKSSNRLSSNNPFAPANMPHNNSSRPFNKELQIYTKGSLDMTWDFSRVEDSLPNFLPNGRPSSSHSFTLAQNARPISTYGLTNGGEGGIISPSWTSNAAGNGVRRSVMVSNGAGQFLGVPSTAGHARTTSNSTNGGARPGSSASYRSNASYGPLSEWPSAQSEEKRGSRYDIWR